MTIVLKLRVTHHAMSRRKSKSEVDRKHGLVITPSAIKLPPSPEILQELLMSVTDKPGHSRHRLHVAPIIEINMTGVPAS